MQINCDLEEGVVSAYMLASSPACTSTLQKRPSTLEPHSGGLNSFMYLLAQPHINWGSTGKG
jgi:hypothetical protein